MGPASDAPSTIERLIRSGMKVARLNLSHGSHDSHAKTAKTIRKAADRLGVEVALLIDLPGPKYRVGELGGVEVTLKRGAAVTITAKDVKGDESLVPVNLPRLPKNLKRGDKVLLDDGAIQLEVLERSGNKAKCRVKTGGVLTERRGVVFPGMPTSGPFVTEALREHLAFAVGEKPDYLAVSFVAGEKDVRRVKDLLREHDADIPIVSKIERVQAVRDFDDILAVSEGVMVARGDLGVDIPLERVPLVQKEIIRKCNRAGVPVITATQMLESMVGAARPTRAETTDVANAIFDGTDAVMLSAETAVGKYPLAAVRTMARIALEAERNLPYQMMLTERRSWIEQETDELISYNACYTAEALGAKAIVAYTQSGSTARRVSKYRSRVPIIAITPDESVCGRLLLHWGVHPVRVDKAPTTVERLFSNAVETVRSLEMAGPGDLIVITAGLPVGAAGVTNLLKVERIEKP